MGYMIDFRVWKAVKVDGRRHWSIMGHAQDHAQASAVGRFLLHNEIPFRVEQVVWHDDEDTIIEIGQNMAWSDAIQDEITGGPIRRAGWDSGTHLRVEPTNDHNAVGRSYVNIGSNRYRLILVVDGEREPFNPTDEEYRATDWCWA